MSECGESLFFRGNTYHVDIPLDERLQDTRPAPLKDFDLNGKTLHEVQEEASRIRLGEAFESFQEFNRCIDSWGVMNHRAVAREKTTSNMFIRNCRFGKSSASKLRESLMSAPAPWTPASIQDKGETHSSGRCGEENCSGNGDHRHFMDAEPMPSDMDLLDNNLDIENQPPAYLLTQEEADDRDFDDGIQQMTHNANVRQPLGNLGCNELQGSLQHHDNQQSGKRKKSVVKHTSQWLPSRHSLLPLNAREKVVRKSNTVHCGELARFTPSIEDDPDGFDFQNPCPFYVRAIRKAKSGVITITKCDLRHNCPQHKHKWRGPTSKSLWLGETLAPRVIRNLKGPVKELTLGFQQDYKRNANYHQMYRAKDKVRDAYLGGQRKSFHCIPGLIERLKLVDPGCKASWEAFHGSEVFHRAFVCPSAARIALQYCQPVVSLDACHSKNRKYPTQLFLASVLDGNMQVLPLAYAIAPTENFDNWKWFLDHLDCAIDRIEQITVPFMSDRCKGLIAAVKEVFPGKIHGMCANHLRGNVKKEFGKAAENFFLATVYATSEELFAEIMNHLKKSTAKGVAAAAYIKNLDASLYARYAFPLPRFGHVTSNPCEATNSGLLHIREYAPFKLLVEMWYYVQKHFNDSRRNAKAWKETLTAPAHRRHNANLKSFGQFQVFDDYGGTAKVCTSTGSEEYLVTLRSRPTCTCWELQDMCWPCEHLMAWDDMMARPFSQNFHSCWRTVNLRKLYEGVIPSFLCNDIQSSNNCWPPEVAKKAGRHRVVWIASGTRVSRAQLTGEDVLQDRLGNLYLQYPMEDDNNLVDAMPSPGTVASRQHAGVGETQTEKEIVKRVTSKCGLCGKPGHNQRTCLQSSTTTALHTVQEQGHENIHTQPRPEEVTTSYPPQSQVSVGDMNADLQYDVEAHTDIHFDELIGLYRSIPGYPESDADEEEDIQETQDLRNVMFMTSQNGGVDWYSEGR